jgi:hypothetical protein
MSVNASEFGRSYYPLANRFHEESLREVRERSLYLSVNGLIAKENEVLLGMLSRQQYLAVMMTHSMNSWNHEFGGIIIRSMVDLLICAHWISKDLIARARMYINYGLGQQKLLNEKLRSKLEADGVDPEKDQQYAAMQYWLVRELSPDFIEVDVANWSGLSVRQMAEQADVKSLYDFAYQPLSFIGHSTWNCVAKSHLKTCDDPLHGYHKIPQFPERYFDFEVPRDAVRYYDKLLSVFDDVYEVKASSRQSVKKYREAFHRLINQSQA